MTGPLRFCMLTTFYPPANFGGDGIQVQRLAHALGDRGHAVTVVHSLEAYEALARHAVPATAPSHPRVEVVPVRTGVGMLSPLATHLSGHPVFVRRRIERILGRGFDVLHFHNPSLLGGPALLELGEGLKLYTAHEQWLLCPSHTLWQHKRRVCLNPPCWSCTLAYRRPPQLWRYTSLIRRGLAELDALIVPSATSATLHERYADVVQIERLPHFVPRPPEKPSDDVPRRDRPFFLFVGRLESIKGVETLFSPFAKRAEDLVIVGSGSLAASLERRARGLPRVHFAGWRSGAELDALYRDAVAVIVPTRGHEAFGLVAVEAFARGTPVVARRFGALAELVVDGTNGYTYADERELEHALDRLANDRALRDALGREGRAMYEARWTPEHHLAAYLDLLASLAGERQSG